MEDREKKWCTENPFDDLDRIKNNGTISTNKDERYESFSSTKLDFIIKTLTQTGQRDYVRFLAMIYYAFARPAEIARLKVGDIDFNKGVIRFAKNDTKNQKVGYVQIVRPLKDLLNEMDLQQYPPNFYVFSGDEKKFFAPGDKKLYKSKSTKVWNELVKQKMQIQKDQYALKHTGSIDYLLRNKGNVDLKWQQMQNRHGSSVMTDRYNRKLGAYFIEVEGLNFVNFD